MKIFSDINSEGTISSITSIKVGNDSTIPSIDTEGSIRYWKDSNNSYVDMVMQTDVGVYEWVNIVSNKWN